MVSRFALTRLPQFLYADTPGKNFRTIYGDSAPSTNFLGITNKLNPVIETNEAEPAPFDTNGNVGLAHCRIADIPNLTLLPASPSRDWDAASEKGRIKVASFFK